MTGSFARSSLQVGSRPQGWMTAPVLAALVMLVVMFFHTALADDLPDNARLILIVVVVIATALWMDVTPIRLRGIGAVEWAMSLYLMWNVYSMLTPHKYSSIIPLIGTDSSPARFIMVGTVIPFLMYVVGRYTFDRPAAVRVLLWTILTLAAYSAWVSILQFTGPTAWVWPRFIVDGSLNTGDQGWYGRAVGVFDQPVVNGMTMVLGFAVAMLLMSRHSETAWQRRFALLIAVACGFGIYLTHTRIVWLCGVVVLIIGALLARGYRTGFIAALGITATIVAINWSVFTGTDRAAGGVGSPSEVQDRLNMIQTSLWAFVEKPVAGWGIGRFAAVNTYHHQQWSPETPWIRGYGLTSHQNELGILAELGLIGLALWICVLALIAYRLWNAYRTLPDDDLCGKPLALTAIFAMAIVVCGGISCDLRFFPFAMATIFLLAGVAIGSSDRHKLAQAAATGAINEPLSHRPG